MVPRFALALGMLTLAATSLLLSAAAGQEWTRFRGPNGSGVSQPASLPAPWTENDYRWKVKLPGVGYSSPVVWGDRVFVTSATEADGSLIVECRKASSGEVLWKKLFPSITYPKHKLNGYASSTPAVDQERLYVTWATPEQYLVVALEHGKGGEIWRRDLGPFISQHGFGASPIVFEDLVILPNDQDGASSVVALDRHSGKTRWQAPRRTESAAFSTPCIYQPEEGKPQLIQSSWSHGISSLDPRSGKLNWELPVFENRVVGSPAIAAGVIFAAAGVGGVGRQMVAVRPGDPERGIEAKVLYDVKGSLPYVVTPVARGPLVFVWNDQGVITCLDAPTGKIHWRQRVGGDFFGSPVRLGDRLCCIARDGKLVVVAAADKYELVARIDLGEPSNSTPAVAGGVIYLRTASQLMAIRGGKGK